MVHTSSPDDIESASRYIVCSARARRCGSTEDQAIAAPTGSILSRPNKNRSAVQRNNAPFDWRMRCPQWEERREDNRAIRYSRAAFRHLDREALG